MERKNNVQEPRTSLCEKIWQLISQNQVFVIGSHIDPDGDSLGAQLALGNALKSLKKEVTLSCCSPVPQNYAFLPGSSSITDLAIVPENIEVLITLDTPSLERLGVSDTDLFNPKTIVNIDHHASNHLYGTINWVDAGTSSTSELVYELLKYRDVAFSKEIALCLYTGILTDTGCFNYVNTSATAHEIAAEMIQLGVKTAEVFEAVYENHPIAKLRLLQRVFKTIKTASQGTVCWAWIKNKMFVKSGACIEDSDGLINYIRALKGVKVALLFEETPKKNVIRISFRSKDPSINVNTIAGRFGGGGHPTAAGASFHGSPRDAERAVIQAVLEELTR